MKDQEAMLAEYNTLRAELIQYQQMNLQISIFTLPVAATVMAYGFQQKYSFAFLAALAILLIALWYSISVLASVSSIGAYIYAIIEPKIEGLQWETLLASKREKENLVSGKSAILGIVIVYIVFSLICLLLAWYFIQSVSALNLAIYSGLTLIFLLLLVLGSAKVLQTVSVQYIEDAAKNWKQLEEELHRKVPMKDSKSSEHQDNLS
jgi:hypothetical protein